MLALCRSAGSIRSQSYRTGASRICLATIIDQSAFDPESGGGVHERRRFTAARDFSSGAAFRGFSLSSSSSLKIFLSGYRSLSSQAGAKSSDSENEPEEGFSELEEPVEAIKDDEKEEDDNDLTSEKDDDSTELDSGDEESELSLDIETDAAKTTSKKIITSKLFDVLMSATLSNVNTELDKYVEGNTIERSDVSIAMFKLRKREQYKKALQLSEWLESNECFDFLERDYASRLDLIAKVHGVHSAERYIEKIPESFRTEVVYRTLLANWVVVRSIKKSEEVFNKIRNLGLPITAFACNQLLLLYKNVGHKKLANVLLMMENENIKPTDFTYRILIDAKGRANDIEGMEQILETMKAEGMVPNKEIQATVAKYYINGGLTDNAEKLLKEIEGDNIIEDRWCCKLLIPLFAASGKADDLERIWEICKENPRPDETLAAIEAWGKLGKVEKAEDTFECVLKKWKKISARYYNTLLNVYAKHNLLSKGKELVKRMSSNGCSIGPPTWDPLVRLYVAAGEVEKADHVLHKAVEKARKKPWYVTYAVLLMKYARRGDIHNAEKIFDEMRMSGYTRKLTAYQDLLEAYVVAKTPAYGFRERMKADNVFPNTSVAGKLRIIETFKKNHISELLD